MPAEPFSPHGHFTRDELIAISNDVLGAPELALKRSEDIFRVECVGLDWDMGVSVIEPSDAGAIARDAAGKKIGVFLLHGGDGDFKSMEPMARLYAGRFGRKTVSMTFPGRLYLDDPSRDWPGDTIKPDGTIGPAVARHFHAGMTGGYFLQR